MLCSHISRRDQRAARKKDREKKEEGAGVKGDSEKPAVDKEKKKTTFAVEGSNNKPKPQKSEEDEIQSGSAAR